MIQANFKKAAAVIGVFSMVLPNVLSAATSTPKFGGQNVCGRLDAFISQMESRVTVREQKILTRQNERRTNWSDRLSGWDEKREQKRSQAETKRSDFYRNLESKAQTEGQKQAVVLFKAALQAAINARKAAVDTAIETFRSAVSRLLQSRQSSIDAAVSAYKAAQKSAFDKAKSSCGSETDARMILETLKTELKTAQDKFQADRQAIEKSVEQLRLLNETKRSAVEKAHQDFKAVLEKAKADLKAAFPQPTPSASL